MCVSPLCTFKNQYAGRSTSEIEAFQTLHVFNDITINTVTHKTHVTRRLLVAMDGRMQQEVAHLNQ